jgi:hypothetical protein
VQAAYEILNSYDHRYLIGDEVGLGKTIEAGIVIEELIARDRVERVLIVAPAPLTVQWQEEMREKFDRNFVIYDRETVRTHRKSHPNQNVWKQEDLIITSIDFAKQTTDEPESDLGMRSDVLGRVLEDADLDETIMAAIAEGEPTERVVADIEATIEEKRDAIQTVENEFLIRDRFDLSGEDDEILDVIERSQHGEVSEDDIETLVRVFFDEFGDSIKGVRPGPARMEGDVFQLDVPEVLSGNQVARQYLRATFTKGIAMEEDDVEFISLDHPLVESLIEFCLDNDRIQGEISKKIAATASRTPGILFNFRLGYVSGAGDVVTEKFVRLYARPDCSVTTDVPELSKTATSGDISSSHEVDRLSSMAESL